MTTAVDAVARQLFAATRPPWRRRDATAAWTQLSPTDKYKRRSLAGEMVLPALQALPERPTYGAHPEFSSAELATASEETGRAMMEYRKPGAWDSMSVKARGRITKSTSTFVLVALESMPVRQDPEASPGATHDRET